MPLVKKDGLICRLDERPLKLEAVGFNDLVGETKALAAKVEIRRVEKVGVQRRHTRVPNNLTEHFSNCTL
jgi:hypothetical protein